MVDVHIYQSDLADSECYFGCLSFERRSTFFISSSYMPESCVRIILFDYKNVDLFSYKDNWNKCNNIDAILLNKEEEYLESFSKAVSSYRDIILDVTCLDRRLMALLLQRYFNHMGQLGRLSLVYCPQTYAVPDRGLEDVVSFGPVTPAFIGLMEPDNEKVCLIAGAGYEYGRLVSAVDFLEPDHVYCYYPVGSDPKFETSIKENNENFEFLGKNDQVISYELKSPDALYYEILSVMGAVIPVSKIIVLPLGPKIFAAVTMICALIHHPKVMVWRHTVSTEIGRGVVRDVEASGEVLTFAFKVSNSFDEVV